MERKTLWLSMLKTVFTSGAAFMLSAYLFIQDGVSGFAYIGAVIIWVVLIRLALGKYHQLMTSLPRVGSTDPMQLASSEVKLMVFKQVVGIIPATGGLIAVSSAVAYTLYQKRLWIGVVALAVFATLLIFLARYSIRKKQTLLTNPS